MTPEFNFIKSAFFSMLVDTTQVCYKCLPPTETEAHYLSEMSRPFVNAEFTPVFALTPENKITSVFQLTL